MSDIPTTHGGWWACRLKPGVRPPQFTNTNIGTIYRYEKELFFVGWCCTGILRLGDSVFHKYDWHRIELPKGWE